MFSWQLKPSSAENMGIGIGSHVLIDGTQKKKFDSCMNFF
jgi:hypothetical protein